MRAQMGDSSLVLGTADLPGGRHDNDAVAFRDVGVLPTAEEIVCSREPYLPVRLNVPALVARWDAAAVYDHQLCKCGDDGGGGGGGGGRDDDPPISVATALHDPTAELPPRLLSEADTALLDHQFRLYVTTFL